MTATSSSSFISAVSSDPKADLTALINANLSDEQIETLQQAIAGSVNRTLRIAAELQFSSVRRGEALFAFDLDVSALTKAGRAAVADALKGRLTALQEAASTSAPGSASSTRASSALANAAPPGDSTCSAS